MLIPFGVLSAAGAGGQVFEDAYELISTTVLTSTAASINFSSLGTYSSTYKHLQIRWSSRAGSTQINLKFNGSSTGYANHRLAGSSTSVFSDGATSAAEIRFSSGSSSTGATANAFSGGILDILDSYSTTKNKTIRTLYGTADSGLNIVNLFSGLWANTSSITSVNFTLPSGSFAIGSRFSLYGIRG
jgi:hypothetical protein